MSPTLPLIITAIAAALAGALLSYLIRQQRINRLQQENARLQAELAAQEKLQQQQEALQHQLQQRFEQLAGQALNRNNETFLQLARENLARFQLQAQNEMGKKEKAIEELVKPLRSALEKTERQIQAMEKERQHAYGALQRHLEGMAQTQQQLHSETRKLVQAFRRPEVRGRWGEMTLKRLAELAGMVEHCDFYEQTSVEDENGRLRPDMIVRLPGGRELVVDIKTPLDAYLGAVESDDEQTRQAELKRHARHLRERIRELASKAYWQQFKNAPDFVILFIPGDQFLNAALDQDPQLLEEALKNKVILSTPTSFVALLRAVAYGWRQEALADNAEQIRQLGEQLYGRLATFAEHLGKLGRSLEQGVGHYNKAVASFESRVLPGARKFSEMGISGKKNPTEPKPVETLTRRLAETEQEDND